MRVLEVGFVGCKWDGDTRPGSGGIVTGPVGREEVDVVGCIEISRHHRRVEQTAEALVSAKSRHTVKRTHNPSERKVSSKNQ